LVFSPRSPVPFQPHQRPEPTIPTRRHEEHFTKRTIAGCGTNKPSTFSQPKPNHGMYLLRIYDLISK
jgi:hypothetical protein